MDSQVAAPKRKVEVIARCRDLLDTGRFSEALALATDQQALRPDRPQWPTMRAQALTAMGRPDEALQVLEDACDLHSGYVKLLRVGRSIAFQNGLWETAIRFGDRILAVTPEDTKVQHLNLLVSLSMGRWKEIADHGQTISMDEVSRESRKAFTYAFETGELKKSHPSMVSAWEVAVGHSTAPATAVAEAGSSAAVAMIQYWSQGELPDDLSIVFSQWDDLATRLGIGPIQLFGRETAGRWIDEHAPEFSKAFATAFHFAMESDIFRIAYASRKPCFYVDTDGWPLHRAADILQTAMGLGSTMLYFRAYRPYIVNGLFLSYPDCPFIRALAEQTSQLDFSGMPTTHVTIDDTFGPNRYNHVLKGLVQAADDAVVTHPEGVPGMSILRLGDASIAFTHEAAVASVKPPFPLAYKTTEDNWKGHGRVPVP